MFMMSKEDAERILRNAEYWHYPFDLPWGRTAPHKSDHADRHFKRRRHFFEPLLSLCAGSLAGQNVLDLGCCQGFWSFECLKAKASSVLGIDSWSGFVEEAKAIATILDIPGTMTFRTANLEDDLWWTAVEPVEITLFLGLFYHLTDPVSVLRRAMKLTKRVIVVDTEVATAEGLSLVLRRRDPNEPTTKKSGCSSTLRTVPTPAALVEILKDGGFKQTMLLKAASDAPTEYVVGSRISIIAWRDR